MQYLHVQLTLLVSVHAWHAPLKARDGSRGQVLDISDCPKEPVDNLLILQSSG